MTCCLGHIVHDSLTQFELLNPNYSSSLSHSTAIVGTSEILRPLKIQPTKASKIAPKKMGAA